MCVCIGYEEEYFNPLPPYGGRPTADAAERPGQIFQSTPSVWRETTKTASFCRTKSDFNPLPPYGGRLEPRLNIILFDVISIHSLRMEGDHIILSCVSMQVTISIHSLRMEGDVFVYNGLSAVFTFQSTPSVWRETHLWFMAFGRSSHFNPLPPYGGRPGDSTARYQIQLFQSTPSVWRETLLHISTSVMVSSFQSTPSVWRETSSV